MKKIVSFLAVMLVAGVTVIAGEVDLEGIKCCVADRPADAAKSADYKDGKVYFCCGGCAGKFEADSKKYATKANHQLVATGQYEQKACPFSGGPLNADTAVKLAGTKVAFCCNNCKGKFTAEADDAKKLAMAFDDKPFAKAFKKKEAKKDN